MKNKKVIACLVAAGLTVCIGAGATLAYLQDETSTITNTFTIGDVEIDLDEPQWDPDKAEDMVPGTTVYKDPYVTNVGQTDAFIAIRVDGIEAMAKKGFVVGELVDEKLTLTDDNVFEWDEDFTLVDQNGVPVTIDVVVDGVTEKVEAGADNGLTLAELDAIAGDTLYFAYEDTLATGAQIDQIDQTPALFDAVKLTTEAEAVTKYLIQKHFVCDTVVGGETVEVILEPNTDGTYAQKPKTDDYGNYVYQYTVIDESITSGAKYVVLNQDGTYSLNTERCVYESHAAALAAVDAMEAVNEDNTIEFNMDIKAAAIQAVNNENEEWKVENTTEWYKLLPEDFLMIENE